MGVKKTGMWLDRESGEDTGEESEGNIWTRQWENPG